MDPKKNETGMKYICTWHGIQLLPADSRQRVLYKHNLHTGADCA